MMNSNLKTLAEIEALRKLAGDIGWTIREIMGRITGYMGCPLAQRYRAIGFTSEDPEWIEWRGRVLDDAHSWRKHAQILLTKFREHDGTAIGNILDAVGLSPTAITIHPFASHYSFGKMLLESADGCFDGIGYEPGMFAEVFRAVGEPATLYVHVCRFIGQAFKTGSSFANGPGFWTVYELDHLVHALNINIDAEFVRAKQMAMALKDSPEPVAEPIQLAAINRFITTQQLYKLAKPHGKATNKSTVNGWTKQVGFPPAICETAREKSYPWDCVRVFVLSDKGFDIGPSTL